MKAKPYIQEDHEQKSIRTFSKNTSEDELVWHFDMEDREIKVVSSGGWSFQKDNHLPRKLTDEETFFVKKGEWHRVIKGHDDLVIEITYL